MKFKLIMISTFFILSSCATVQLTSSGQQVRTISPVVAQDCAYNGMASSFMPVISGGLAAAQVDIRNKIASLGGNAMIIISQTIDPPPYQHGRITAEAYYCDFQY